VVVLAGQHGHGLYEAVSISVAAVRRLVASAVVSAGLALLVFAAVVALAQGSGDDDRGPGPSQSVDDGYGR
jgi:hypothetical protein